MFIKEITVKNFKCLQDNNVKFRVPDGHTYGSGLNIFVGENNSGKSSLMEASYFVRNKPKKDVKRLGSSDADESYVEQVFVGGDMLEVIENFVQENKKQAFQNCIETENGEKLFRVRRSFKNEEDVKKILFYSPTDKVFSNPTGIDAPFQKFFQTSNIWADTNPESESKFGATTVCGNLLSDISEKFKIDHNTQYDNFLKAFQEMFNDDTSGLQSDLNDVAKETEKILNKQFGDAKLRFYFDDPEPEVMFKNIKIFVNDGEETEISEKGHGMQRAVILSLLQVYAKRITELKDKNGNVSLKPHFLFIDEPELGLHPQAQRKLFDALCVLSTSHQVFITTHSENFISTKVIENVYKFSKNNTGIGIYDIGKNTLKLAENRNFFLHHHKLFFAKNAIFVEGIDDFERFPLFCQNEGMIEILKDFHLLSGCGLFRIFLDFCKAFGINGSVILDVDVLSVTNNVRKNFPTSVLNKINALNKTATRKNPSSLLEDHLSAEEQNKKMDIINELKGENIFVLSEGAIEQYLNSDGTVVDGDSKKKNELLGIFSVIKSKIIS